jgi:hypothetical protein
MHKFRGKGLAQSHLEVLDWARYRPGTLNRQAIILLSTLGVPDRVFLDLQVTPHTSTCIYGLHCVPASTYINLWRCDCINAHQPAEM